MRQSDSVEGSMLTTTAVPQEGALFEVDARTRRDERLRAGGVRIPSRQGAHPIRYAGRVRPKWLAFLLRLFA